MQQDQSSGSGHVVLPSQAPGPSSSNSPIDLKDFPSHLDYSPVVSQERHMFMEDSNQLNLSSSAFSKASPYNSLSKSRMANLYPKIRRKPFQCKFCTFSCPSATNLAIHMRIHTGEKPYKCGICSYASARKQNLFRHMSTVHKVDHVTMSGPPSATCAYPVGAHTSVEERMPVVENVYGNVQDVFLIDGDSVKVIGRDQGTFPLSDATAANSNITSATNEQNDGVEVVSVTNPPTATEYSTRHYADGSRFVFAGGMSASSTSPASDMNASQTAILDQQFDPHKDLQQTPPGESSSKGVQSVHVQNVTLPDEGVVHKTNDPSSSAVHKEPITGALKRKQGRVTSLTALKNILDSPSMIQNKHTSPPTLGLSKSFEKLGTEFKIIQNEDDLDEVLEGSRSRGVGVSSTGGSKVTDNTPSPRYLNGGTSGETSSFTFSGNAPNNLYCQESTSKSGTEKVVTSVNKTNPSTIMGVFHEKSPPSVRMSLARGSNDQQTASSRNSSDNVIIHMPGGSKVTNVISRHLVQKFNENLSHSSNQTVDREGFRSEGKSCTYPYRNTPVRKYSPASAVDFETDQQFVPRDQPKPTYKKYGRASLTVEVDLTKVMCCTARKWLQSHLLECDVCEINLPNEREEKGCSGCSPRCCRERIWTSETDESIHGNKSYKTEKLDWGNHKAGRTYSTGDFRGRNPTCSSVHKREDEYNTDDTREDDLGEQVAVEMETEGEKTVLKETNPEDQVQTDRISVTSDYIAVGEANPTPAEATEDTTHEQKRQEYCNAKTSSHAPISTPYATPKAPHAAVNLARNVDKPWESAEYVISKSGHFKEIRCVKRIRNEYICDICEKICRSYSQLQSHRRVHVETSQLFRCALCRYCTLHYRLLKRHIMTKHTSMTKKNAFTKCNICKKTVTVSMATLHMQTVHGIGIKIIKGKSSTAQDSTYPSQHESVEAAAVKCVTQQDQFTDNREQSGSQHQDAVTMETNRILQVTQETPCDETEDTMETMEETSMAIKNEPIQD